MKAQDSLQETKIYILAALIGILIGILINNSARADELDYGRTCLAAVGYTEARSEPYAGVVEAERVVIFRLLVEDHRFGNTICEVAEQLGQFEGMTTLRPPWIIRESEAWEIAMQAANAVISTKDTSDCAGALHFSQVKPAHPLCHIGKHWFSK